MLTGVDRTGSFTAIKESGRRSLFHGNRAFERWMFPLAVLFGCCAIAGAFLHAEEHDLAAVFTSDTLYLPSIYQDVVVEHGRFLDWSLNPAPNFFPDMPLFFTLEWLFGSFITATYAFAIVQFVLIAVGFRWILRVVLGDDGERPATFGVLVLTLIPLGALTQHGFMWALQMLYNAFHTGAFVNALFATALFLRTVERMTVSRSVWLALLVLLASASDRLFWLMFPLPAAVAVCLFALRKGMRGHLLRPLALMIASGFAGHMVVQWLDGASGMNIEEPYAFMAFDRIALSWTRLWEVLGALFGATLVIAASVVLTSAVVVCVMRNGTRIIRRQFELRKNEVSEPPPLGPIVIVMATVFFPVIFLAPVFNGSFDGGDSLRYNFSVFMLAFLLMGLVIRDLSVERAYRAVLYTLMPIGVLALAGVISGVHKADAVVHYQPARVKAVDRMAQQFGLRTGVAEYWDAKLIDLFSANGLKVLPVFENLGLYIHVNREEMFYRSTTDAPMEYSFVVMDRAKKFERIPSVLQQPCELKEEADVALYVMPPWRFDPNTRRPFGAAP